MSEDSVVIEHLYKRFGDFVAVNDVNLRVGKGEIFGFLGPNGAGKSTLMKILGGVERRDAGDVLLDGKPVEITSPREASPGR